MCSPVAHEFGVDQISELTISMAATGFAKGAGLHQGCFVFRPSSFEPQSSRQIRFQIFLRSQTGVVLVGVQSAKVIDQWDDGVNLPFFLCKHRFPLGEYANAFNTVFGFGGGDLQGGLLMNGYFAKCVQGVETYGSGPMMFEPCVASWEDFVGASHASEKPVVHKRLIASRASAHKVQD